MTIQQAKFFGQNELKETSPSPVLDTEVLLMSLLKKDRTWILFNRDEILDEETEEQFKSYINVRKTGLPVAYITGIKEFYGRNFFVCPDVLIPKPDTEILVEKSIDACVLKIQNNPSRIIRICDMCTGSGCVGLSILAELMERNVTTKEFLPQVELCDISEKALDVAKKNAVLISQTTSDPALFMDHIKFIRTNLFLNIQKSFDVISTNPPYIPQKEACELLKDGRSEPMLALNGDINLEGDSTGKNDGLGIMENLVPQAYDHLYPMGILLAESGEYNAEMTEYIFRSTGFKNTKIFKDLEGQLRVTYGEKTNAAF